MRSLGIIIYPDGSQAEIFEFDLFNDIVRLKKPRKLTMVFE